MSKGKIGCILAHRNRRHLGSILILGGAVMLLVSLLLLTQPHYTYAGFEDETCDERCRIAVYPDSLFDLGNMNPGDCAERIITVEKLGDLPAYLWVMKERIGGTSLPGEPGDLYTQLEMTMEWSGMTLYSGPMDGLEEPLNISELIGPIRPGQVIEIQVSVYLHGPSTTNEYQGSTLQTRFLFHTECGTETEEPPLPPGATPPLPPTSGIASIALVITGIILIGSGIAINIYRSIAGYFDRQKIF